VLRIESFVVFVSLRFYIVLVAKAGWDAALKCWNLIPTRAPEQPIKFSHMPSMLVRTKSTVITAIVGARIVSLLGNTSANFML